MYCLLWRYYIIFIAYLIDLTSVPPQLSPSNLFNCLGLQGFTDRFATNYLLFDWGTAWISLLLEILYSQDIWNSCYICIHVFYGMSPGCTVRTELTSNNTCHCKGLTFALILQKPPTMWVPSNAQYQGPSEFPIYCSTITSLSLLLALSLSPSLCVWSMLGDVNLSKEFTIV